MTPDLQLLERGFHRTLARLRADSVAAAKLISVGDARPDSTLESAELASYSTVLSTILNLDETLSRE